MNKQKLIMENWRRFLKENKNPSKLEHYYRAIEEAKDNPQALEEGMAEAVLAAIMAFGSAGGNNVEVNGMLISPEEATQAVHMIQRLDKNKYTEAPDAIQEIGDIFTSATKNLEQGLDGDGDGNVGTVAGGDYQLNDGSGDLRFGQSGEPLALAALQKADNASSASPSDTGSPDTGATAATRTNWDGVLMNLSNELKDLIEEGKILISIVPDIESVNYGRGVGYEIIEHVPPTNIKEVSATKIREQMRKEGKL